MTQHAPFVVANKDAVVRWVEAQTGVSFIQPYTSLGFFKRGRITAGIVFHHWTVCDVEMGAAILPGGISRSDLRGVAKYIFERENCRRVTLITPETNDKAQRIALRLGFQFECIRKDFYPDCDGVMFRMLKTDCKWM